MITIIPIEPLSEEHGMLIVEAFNKHFVNRGGQQRRPGSPPGRMGWVIQRGLQWGLMRRAPTEVCKLLQDIV